LALALGAIGVFGTVSYAVSRRRLEFAVRMALGASPSEVRREMLTFGLALVVIGIAAGSLAAVGGTRLLSGFLYDLAPTDAPSFIVSAARASRTNPADALRA
jgi:putative ABC transport system permease protein